MTSTLTAVSWHRYTSSPFQKERKTRGRRVKKRKETLRGMHGRNIWKATFVWKKRKKKQNGLRLWSRGKKAILINLSRRFFLPFVIHKERKKPLIFLPISRSNFSNTRIPPLNPLFELIQRIELVFCWYTTWFICQWTRENNFRQVWPWMSRPKSYQGESWWGGRWPSCFENPFSNLWELGIPGYPEISSPRNNPCSFLTTIPRRQGYFFFQPLTETFPYWIMN